MGRNSGSVYSRTGGKVIGVTSSGLKLTKAQVNRIHDTAKSLDRLPNSDMIAELRKAQRRYDAVMGLRERKIMIADVPGAYGVTFLGPDGSHGIYLDEKTFSRNVNDFSKMYRQKNYENGFKNLTNKPAMHTITHELAHSQWSSAHSAPNARAAGAEINAMFNRWRKDTKKKGYGSYGSKDIDEFWAEVVAKAVHGRGDDYTMRAKQIVKKYKL